jgi:hypothetical protein
MRKGIVLTNDLCAATVAFCAAILRKALKTLKYQRLSSYLTWTASFASLHLTNQETPAP